MGRAPQSDPSTNAHCSGRRVDALDPRAVAAQQPAVAAISSSVCDGAGGERRSIIARRPLASSPSPWAPRGSRTVSRKDIRAGRVDAPDGAPVYLHDVTTPGGVRDIVYVQGEHGHLIAMDGHTGATIWSDNFGPGGIANSSPAIDPSRNFIYINANDSKVHKVAVDTGAEVKSGGWPVATGPGKSRSALTIATARNGHT